jgi:hypothetical protein
MNNTPSGINIGDFDCVKPAFGNSNDGFCHHTNKTVDFDINKDMTTDEIITFFPSIFDSKPDIMSNSNNSIFNFEKKLATNSYGKYGKNFVTDLTEFVTGTTKIK